MTSVAQKFEAAKEKAAMAIHRFKNRQFFATTKKGEVSEFREELRAQEPRIRKDAVKKVIAAMTVGKDVSMLFTDVVNCMQTEDLELKKLVYLYIINYAKTKPDLAILAVNTFVKDSMDPNPLIRALAVRTMGCIRVDRILEYICDPLRRCIRDQDPYVRKTAAVCVAKLYDISADLAEDRGFVDALVEMVGDSNPMVVANAVAALTEIDDISTGGAGESPRLEFLEVGKLLVAVNECTEWGQVFLLDALARIRMHGEEQARMVIERVIPRLSHVNSAVVLSAIRVILHCMDSLPVGAAQAYSRKLAPPLVTLLSAEPEVQYVALRNIVLIVQKYPEILAHEIKVFFCKYNDPLYVKMEKLEIMVMLASLSTVDLVLMELKEYALEVDVDFVRKAVRCIGRCAVKLRDAAQRCIDVLLELIQTRVTYLTQEAVVVIKDIFRRYPNRYESVISQLCESLEGLDEPEAKASMVWIIGEYAERIDNAQELLDLLLESFPEETHAVQLQLLTAAVKLFLQSPTEASQQMIQLVLSSATQDTDDPDLRDRAYIYWRLLSTDPEVARAVVMCERPEISPESSYLPQPMLNQLLGQVATLASVYHRPATSFVTRHRQALQSYEALQARRQLEDAEEYGGEVEDSAAAAAAQAAAQAGAAAGPSAAAAAAQAVGGISDLLDLSGDDPAPAPAAPQGGGGLGGGLDDILGVGDAPAPAPAPAPAAAAPGVPTLLTPEQGRGMRILGRMARVQGGAALQLQVDNTTGAPVDGFMIQVNKNAFGLQPAQVVMNLASVAPGGSGRCVVPLAVSPAHVTGAPAPRLQIAVKTNQLGVAYFECALAAEAVCSPDGAVTGGEFLQKYPGLPETPPGGASVSLPAPIDPAALSAKLSGAGLHVVHTRPTDAGHAVFASCKFGGTDVLLDLRLTTGAPSLQAHIRAQQPDAGPMFAEALQRVLGQ
ncbi:unnamed protein product [Pedinophyceae sp. YPF-701]|nr:unnamed protein product [Pedinophyceae sp. YPF-701]